MSHFEVGDRVRIDIPDESDPDHIAYHGVHGTIKDIIVDDAAQATGENRDSILYRVKLETEETVDFRWRDLRPPLD